MENTTSKSYPNSQAGRSGTNWHGLGLVMGTYMDTNFDGANGAGRAPRFTPQSSLTTHSHPVPHTRTDLYRPPQTRIQILWVMTGIRHAHLKYRRKFGAPLLPAGAGPGRRRFAVGRHRDGTGSQQAFRTAQNRR